MTKVTPLARRHDIYSSPSAVCSTHSLANHTAAVQSDFTHNKQSNSNLSMRWHYRDEQHTFPRGSDEIEEDACADRQLPAFDFVHLSHLVGPSPVRRGLDSPLLTAIFSTSPPKPDPELFLSLWRLRLRRSLYRLPPGFSVHVQASSPAYASRAELLAHSQGKSGKEEPFAHLI